MKKKLTRAALFLLMVTGLGACKKEDSGTVRSQISGRWVVNKIEVKTYDANGALTGTTSTNYTASDYIDFKTNETNEVNLSLSGTVLTGSYTTFLNGTFNVNFTSKLLSCSTDVITDNTFQFTGAVNNSNPKTTETYYLTR